MLQVEDDTFTWESEGGATVPFAFEEAIQPPPVMDSSFEKVEREAIQAEAPILPQDSFVAQYVAYACQRTDAPREAHELMAVGVLSSLAGPNPRLPLATNVRGVPLTLWVLYIVDSTTGRKSSTIDYAVDLAQEVLGRDAMIFWEGSPQAILQRLSERDGLPCVFVRDEYSGLLGQMNKGGHMAGLTQTFIRAYDGSPLENNRTKKRNKTTGILDDDSDRAEHPYLAKLCASTFDSFVTRATIDNVQDGFLARFIVVTGASVPRRMERSTPELEMSRQSAIEHARVFHRKATVLHNVDIDEESLDRMWDIERDFIKRAVESSRPDAAGPALKRLADSVLKVAALLAIDDAVQGEIPCVSIVHLECARRMAIRWLDSTIKLIDALGRTSFQKDCDAVFSSIRIQPAGIKISDLYRRHRQLQKRDFDQILAALLEQELIAYRPVAKSDKKLGRRALIVTTIGGAE